MNWANFIESLKLMGMGGIFAFIMIFCGLALVRIFPQEQPTKNN
jgi:hypothetical protein